MSPAPIAHTTSMPSVFARRTTARPIRPFAPTTARRIYRAPRAAYVSSAEAMALRVDSDVGKSGDRTASLISPRSASAAFTGLGFDSMNIESCTRKKGEVRGLGFFDLAVQGEPRGPRHFGREHVRRHADDAPRPDRHHGQGEHVVAGEGSPGDRPSDWASFCARSTFPVASFTATTFGAAAQMRISVSGRRSADERPGTL